MAQLKAGKGSNLEGRSCCRSSSQEADFEMKLAGSKHRLASACRINTQVLREGSEVRQRKLLGCHVVPTRNPINPKKECGGRAAGLGQIYLGQGSWSGLLIDLLLDWYQLETTWRREWSWVRSFSTVGQTLVGSEG